MSERTPKVPLFMTKHSVHGKKDMYMWSPHAYDILRDVTTHCTFFSNITPRHYWRLRLHYLGNPATCIFTGSCITTATVSEIIQYNVYMVSISFFLSFFLINVYTTHSFQSHIHPIKASQSNPCVVYCVYVPIHYLNVQSKCLSA